MKRLLIALVAALALLVPGWPAFAAVPPPAPGAWQPTTPAGCYKSVLERHTERRVTSYRSVGGSVIRYVEFRHVASVLHWCPRTGYVVKVWRGVWGPGRR